jgi:hypothetical protein
MLISWTQVDLLEQGCEGQQLFFEDKGGLCAKKFGKYWNKRLGGTQSCPGRFLEENPHATSENQTTILWASSQ